MTLFDAAKQNVNYKDAFYVFSYRGDVLYLSVFAAGRQVVVRTSYAEKVGFKGFMEALYEAKKE